MKNFRDSEHLLRFAFLFAMVLALFLIVRHFVVPKSFGEYGHYRGAAIGEIAARPIHFAGQSACATCHTDIAATKQAGMHAGVHCEACHGPLAKHAADPASVQPPKLDTAVLCVRCHAASAAKPKNFPQVAAAEHSGGLVCETCHHPHSPAIQSEGAK